MDYPVAPNVTGTEREPNPGALFEEVAKTRRSTTTSVYKNKLSRDRRSQISS